jgi:hypothetical protein
MTPLINDTPNYDVNSDYVLNDYIQHYATFVVYLNRSNNEELVMDLFRNMLRAHVSINLIRMCTEAYLAFGAQGTYDVLQNECGEYQEIINIYLNQMV